MPSLSIPEFVANWQSREVSERADAQTHFNELWAALHASEVAPATGEHAPYIFEQPIKKLGGGIGFVDVWLPGRFVWEYKGRGKPVTDALTQLLQYKDSLDNPPILVGCNFQELLVRTNFNGVANREHRFPVAALADPAPLKDASLPAAELLRAAFHAPERLKPDQTPAQVTEEAARGFAQLAASLRAYGAPPEEAAHFLMRLLFCLFAQSARLLPGRLFTHLVESTRTRSFEFSKRLAGLFRAMAEGGYFGADDIPHFNGGLFADDRALDLITNDLDLLLKASQLDWAAVEPAIFGTLFERSLDPSKRAQLGAHYTGKQDILRIVEPVLMAPLRREWEGVKEQARSLAQKRDEARGASRIRHHQSLERLLTGFTQRIAGVRVLDPACGSGNFLYVALKEMLDLEWEVATFGATLGMSYGMPWVGPEQLYGIEVNPYAHELAQVVVWIGYIQWLRDHGLGVPSHPILKPLTNIRRMDAILAWEETAPLHGEAPLEGEAPVAAGFSLRVPGRLPRFGSPGGSPSIPRPVEPAWPEADVVIGNPPFLGGKRMRAALGDGYMDALFALYDGRVSREADLVCYWFERSRALVEAGKLKRAGLLATQAIRGGANRRVLERIKETGDIFMAWADRPWVLDGAAVRVSMVGFDGGLEVERALDEGPVAAINANLTAALDLTTAKRLPENAGLAFMGITKVGPFDIPGEVARQMLASPNPHCRPNADVIRPWVHGKDLNQRSRDWWIIDFPLDMTMEDASLYEAPFTHVDQLVKPKRLLNARKSYAERWWIHGESRPAMRRALASLARYIATCMVAKHRLFVWLPKEALAENVVIVIARDDDYFFGVLHSRLHELWARHTGTQLREAESGFRYTPTTCFDTFPFPWPPGAEPAGDPRVEAIASAARELVCLRDRWLNPEGASEEELKKRTLTNLYNARPEWLRIAHRRLDDAVLDAYGWPHDLPDDAILERLLALNHQRSA